MYVFDGRIRYSEIGADGRLTPEKLIDYFQDCSTFQSEDAGVGVSILREHKLAWIIVYWRVEISRMPLLGEQVRVGTLPYEMKGGVGLRNFLIETKEGERLAAANSVWSLIDTETGHPVRIPPQILEKYPLEERIDMLYDSRKIRVPKEEGTKRPPVIVKEYHLDTNRHVNNGQYVRIAAGLLPQGAIPEILRIEYRRQAVLGDRMTPVIYNLPAEKEIDAVRSAEKSIAGKTQRVCVSLNADDGKPYAVLEIGFRIP